MAFIIHLSLFIPANRSRDYNLCTSWRHVQATSKGTLVSAVTPAGFMPVSHSANSCGLGSLGCISGFDYV